MADVRRGGQRAISVVLTLCATSVVALVTEEDLLFLSGDQNIPHCFSRNFMKITCYWEAEELEAGRDVTYGFYYSYDEDSVPHKESEEECDIRIQNGSPALYVCEHDDVRLFNNFHVFIKDKSNNQILRQRTIQVEMLGIFPYPGNIRVTWDDSRDQMVVRWDPPESEFSFILQYEVQYWWMDSADKQQKIVSGDELTLTQLLPHLRYQLRVRTSWIGENAIWGPWSDVIMFESSGYSDISGLKCFTSDLTFVCCQWKEETDIDLPPFQQIFYRYREEAWQSCRQAVTLKDCDCAFLARNDGTVSLKIKVPTEDGDWSVYYPKPFWVHHVVLPPVPELRVQQLPGNILALNWSSPLPELEEDLMYQIRFSQDGEKTWTTLQVPGGVRNKTLSVVSGTSYVLQLRTAPRADKIQGFWSDWSARVTVKIPSSTEWIILVIALCLLFLLVAVTCVCFKFPFLFSKLKNELWPPVPNLHRVLDTFLTEIQKQYQPNSALYEKTHEDVPQPSCLEILSEVTHSNEGQTSSRDYVQLSPPSYQNEDYWPKLELLDLHLERNDKNQPSSALINQTYLPTSWSL